MGKLNSLNGEEMKLNDLENGTTEKNILRMNSLKNTYFINQKKIGNVIFAKLFIMLVFK